MKKKCWVTNWRKYNQALKQRGSLTFWFEEEFERAWYDYAIPKKSARPFTYLDVCIKILATMKYVFNKALRQLEKFVVSLFKMKGITLQVPNFFRMCCRLGDVVCELKFPKPERISHVVIDSCSLKVFGEKEWLKTKMGETYQRKIWREIHIGVDGKGNILDIQMTNHKTSGRVMLKTITENIETEFIDELLGDGGYARHYNYRYLKENNINTLIFPLKNARIIENIPDLETHNNIVAYINEKDFTLGKKNNFYRLKTIFGRKLKSKNWHTLESETNLIAHLLNQMINFGMPEKMKVS